MFLKSLENAYLPVFSLPRNKTKRECVASVHYSIQFVTHAPSIQFVHRMCRMPRQANNCHVVTRDRFSAEPAHIMIKSMIRNVYAISAADSNCYFKHMKIHAQRTAALFKLNTIRN